MGTGARAGMNRKSRERIRCPLGESNFPLKRETEMAYHSRPDRRSYSVAARDITRLQEVAV